MTLTELLDKVRNKSLNIVLLSDWWYDIYLRLSLYINGVKPNYCIDTDQWYKWPSRRFLESAVPYNKIFDTEIFCRYPHDSFPQLNFRKSIAAIDDMKSICDKFFEQSRSIIFQGNNFTVNTDDVKLKEWIDTVRIDGFEFYEWVKHVLYTRMFVDPNAWLCVVENHQQILLPSEFAMPMPTIISSAEIRYADRYRLVSDRYAVDSTMQILHNDFKPESFVNYPHNMGETPVIQLGGKHVKDLVWQSFIHSFVGIANTYIQEKSDSVIAKKILAPRLQVIESKCPQCNGRGKCDTVKGPVKCDGCDGKGTQKISLGEAVIIPEPVAILDDKLANLDRFKYTTPDPGYIDLLTKDADKEFMRAEKALFLFRKETAAAESANNLDKQFEEKKIFFQGVSERLYYLMYEMVKYVSMYLNYNNGKPKASQFTIDKPISFDLASAEDLMLQYESERKNQLPNVITNNSQLNYLKKVEGDNSIILKKVKFLQLYDPLYGIPANFLTAGYDGLAVATHNYLSQLLELYIIEIKEAAFLERSYAEIYAALLPQLQARVPTTTEIF